MGWASTYEDILERVSGQLSAISADIDRAAEREISEALQRRLDRLSHEVSVLQRTWQPFLQRMDELLALATDPAIEPAQAVVEARGAAAQAQAELQTANTKLASMRRRLSEEHDQKQITRLDRRVATDADRISNLRRQLRERDSQISDLKHELKREKTRLIGIIKQLKRRIPPKRKPSTWLRSVPN